MRLILIILLSSIFRFGTAQEGLIQAYDFGLSGMAFYSMLLEEDTLVIYGTGREDSTGLWGFVFAKIDTLGNLVDYNIYFDISGIETYVLERDYQLIKTTDGGYAGVGVALYSSDGLLIKLDEDGNLEFLKQYYDDVLTTQQRKIVETPSGYLISGTKQLADFTQDIFVMKVDKQGNKEWEVFYGDPAENDYMGSLVKVDENTYVIGAGQRTFGSSIEDAIRKSRLIAIDSLGEIKWEWETDVIENQPGIVGLNQTEDGGWIYCSRTIELDDYFPNEWNSRGRIVKLDSERNIEWITLLGAASSSSNGLTTMIPDGQGNWIAVGQQFEYIDESASNSAWLTKVNGQGDSLWSRLDTIFWHPVVGSDNVGTGLVVLPSGSIIACGYLNRWQPQPAKSFGWLIKVDQHGCIEPGCNPNVGTHAIELLSSVEVFPNPASEWLYIRAAGSYDCTLYDMQGQLHRQLFDQYDECQMDLTGLVSGTYVLHVEMEGKVGLHKVIKVE